MRRRADGKRVARAIADLPLTDRDNVLRKTRLHMDATRSSALFAERLVLVEGRFALKRYARSERLDPRGVVAVSFTRAATREPRMRVARQWGRRP